LGCMGSIGIFYPPVYLICLTFECKQISQYFIWSICWSFLSKYTHIYIKRRKEKKKKKKKRW
jgi:hypothetical protein